MNKTAKKAGRPTPGEGPVKVLLAEDEESFIEALVIGLTNEGFRVTVARDGNEALQLFDETVPDILLLDLMLPKLSGIDVCRAIRARSQVPIIMVTAKGTEIDTVVALEVGADDYVTKPYRLRELVARMRAVLRRAPGGSESGDLGGSIEFGSDGIWESNGIKVDFDQRRVFVRGEDSLPLGDERPGGLVQLGGHRFPSPSVRFCRQPEYSGSGPGELSEPGCGHRGPTGRLRRESVRARPSIRVRDAAKGRFLRGGRIGLRGTRT